MTLRNPEEMYQILGFKILTDENTLIDIPGKKSNKIVSVETADSFKKKVAVVRAIVVIVFLSTFPLLVLFYRLVQNGLLVDIHQKVAGLF